MISQEQAVEFVIQGLGRGIRRDDLVESLCQQTGGSRQQVESFVRMVESRHREAIAAVAQPSTQTPAAPPATRERSDQAADYQVYERDQSQSAEMATYEKDRWQADEAQGRTDRERSVQFVLESLKRDVKAREIIRALCEENNWSWEQAQHFVKRVEIEHFDQVATAQNPLMITLGVGTIVVGSILTLSMVYLTLNGYRIDIWLPYFSVPYGGNVTLFVVGIGMVLGGIAGLWQSINLWLEVRRIS